MVNAVEANLFSLFQQLSGWPRVEVHDDRDCLWTLSDVQFPLFNSVMRARVGSHQVDALIGARIESCRDRGVPMLWWTGPSTAPADLGSRLERRGFLLEPAYGMAVRLDGGVGTARISRDSSVTIEEVCDRATLEEWSRVLCDAFGAPPPFGEAFGELACAIGLGAASSFRHFMARQHGQAIATCSVFFGAGVAGIYDVSTLPERRRRGLGALITSAAMEQARQRGCEMAILHASALGRRMYRSLGFTDVCAIGQYVWASGIHS